MFRSSTGEAWQEIMLSCVKDPSVECDPKVLYNWPQVGILANFSNPEPFERIRFFNTSGNESNYKM